MNTLATPLLALLFMTSGGLGGPAPAPASPSTGVWPLEPAPRVVSRFDPPLTRYAPGHRGVDLAGSPGQRVRSAAAGRVTFAGSLAGRGVVVVSHGTTRTTYEPVRAKVEVGAVVAAGEVLGTLQSFASHCAPATCLHWGLVQGETYLDPLTLLGRGPVRLLPLYGPAAPVDPSPRPGPAKPVRTSTWSPVLRLAGAPAGRPDAAGRW